MLLCDEPTGSLDSHTGENILNLLQKLNQKFNKNVILITHNEKIAMLADRVVRLKDGSVEDISEPSIIS